MKFEQHKFFLEPAAQQGASLSGFNYRGPGQALKSLRQVAAKPAPRGMIDILASDLSLDELFVEHPQPEVGSFAIRDLRI